MGWGGVCVVMCVVVWCGESRGVIPGAWVCVVVVGAPRSGCQGHRCEQKGTAV